MLHIDYKSCNHTKTVDKCLSGEITVMKDISSEKLNLIFLTVSRKQRLPKHLRQFVKS